VAFTTAFASGLSAGSTTLSTAQIPSHTHTNGVATSGGNQDAFGCGTQFRLGQNTGSTGGGGSHDHSLPSFAVSYVDVIIATKN
jgi:microcystin-dependent protein